MKLFQKILPVLPFLLVFISTLYLPYDADLGWHLKYGEYFVKNGQILKTNLFSQEMPNFYWPDISWGYDVIIFLTYNFGGFLALSLLASLVITLTFYFFSKFADLTFWDQVLLFPILIIVESPINQVSLRAQLVGILMLGIIFYLTKFENSKKFYLLIPLFLIFANLHGLYIMGLLLLGLWMFLNLVLRFYESKFNFSEILGDLKKYFFVFVLSVLATLINPFFIDIYKISLSHFNNPSLYLIIEYLPIEELSQTWWHQIIMGILIMFGFIILFFSDKLKSKLPTLGLVSVLYAISFLVRRYAWVLYYLTLPLLKPISEFFKPDSKKAETIASTIIIIFSLATVLYLKWPLTDFSKMNWDIYCSQFLDCSPKALEYLKTNQPEGKFFSLYNWGGFMIWNYPEVKPSVDGRMHLWKDESGYSAFEKYYPIEQNLEDVDKSDYDLVLTSPKKLIYDRLQELVAENKWKILYKDDKAAIFQRIKS